MTPQDRLGSISVLERGWQRTIGKKFVREFCGNQCCTVVHRGALSATGAPANRLM